MLDDDIRKLDVRTAARSLAGLEADIWAGVEARNRSRQLTRTVVSFQAVFLAVGLITSVIAGTQVGMSTMVRAPGNVLSVASEFTPTSRLIGH